MIQRIQTIYLLLAAVTASIWILLPAVAFSDDPIRFIPLGIASLISLITIFLYKTRKKQMALCKWAIVFVIIYLLYQAYMMFFNAPNNDGALNLWPFIPAIAIIFNLLAYRGIRHDERLIRSADRLR